MTQSQPRSSFGLLMFFLLLHVINQIDRQLVAGFASDIMHDLALTRSQFALVPGLAFSLVYAATALAAGVLADRIGRVAVLTAGVGVWSVFTGLTALAQGFSTLIGARPFVAAGEATLVPTATNIILGRTPEGRKSSAIGLFFAGMAASILFMTMIYGPLFSVIEEELPAHLKATATGINMLALNVLMIGGLTLAFGGISQALADAGVQMSWTWPLLGADVIAFSGLFMVWRATRYPAAAA